MKGQKKLTRREMLKLSGGLAASSVLAASVPVALEQTPVAQAQGAVTLEVYDPTGAVEVTRLFAPRIDTLEGKTICELSDMIWQYDRTFPLIRSLLQKQFPTAKFVPFSEFPEAPTDEAAAKKVAASIKAKGCQAVIVGNAG